MPFSLIPTHMTGALTDLTADFLRSRGVKLLMLDFDNTIVPYTTTVPTPEMERWLENMNALEDIRLCIVSNSHNHRVPNFCCRWGIDVITHARKPFPTGIRACLIRYGVAPQQAMLVGDQIFTDTLGGNCAGVRTVLVRAIDNHNLWLKARHVLEMPFIYAARKRRL